MTAFRGGGGALRRAIRYVLERLLLLVFSLLVCLGMLEGYLRATVKFLPEPDTYVEDWDLGKRLRPGFVGDHYGAPVAISSQGLRDREYPEARPAGTLRILALGDSWTFGVGVAQDEPWPKRLEADLNAQDPGTRYEVMNTGVSGYETYNEALYYQRDLARFEHDLVVVGLYPVNDVHDKERKYAMHKRLYELSPLLYLLYTEPKQHLMLHHWYKQWRQERKLRRRAANYAKTAAEPALASGASPFPPGEEDWTALYDERYSGWRTMQESLASIGRTARAAGAEGAVVLFPDLRDLARWEQYSHPRVAPKLAKAVEEAGLHFIDLREDFAPYRGREAEIGLDGAGPTHPNAAGHALIGHAIARELRARGLLARGRRPRAGPPSRAR